MEFEVRASVPWKDRPGYSSSVRNAAAPVSAAREYTSGIATKTRSVSIAARWNNSLPAELAPASINAPTSVLRAVTIPIKRRIDLLERLQILKPVNIGSIGIRSGLFGAQVGNLLVGFLLGDGVALQQEPPPGLRCFGQMIVGLRGFKIGTRLLELLVDFGSFDFSQ